MNKELRISVISLIIVNIFTIFLAIFNHWDVKTLMIIYWCQSIIIGIFQFLKIKNLKKFSTEGFSINDVPAQPTQATKNYVLIFFPLHYGFFHFGYLMFLGLANLIQNFYVIIIPVAAFFVNHLVSYLKNKESDSNKVVNIGHLMFLPYLRTVPMHFTMFVASKLNLTITTLVVFLVLKMIVDVIMHIVEHKMYSTDT